MNVGSTMSNHRYRSCGSFIPLEEGGGCPEGTHTVEDDESGQAIERIYHVLKILLEMKIVVNGTSLIVTKKELPVCNGQARTDGITICDQPEHPGYKYCNDN